MTKRIAQMELLERLPWFRTHAEWCNWLWSKGCLSPQHRRCRVSDHCVAGWAQPTGEPWRYVRKEQT